MNYLQNHIWCSESNWDNSHYDCRHLVSLSSYEKGYAEDWGRLIDEKADTYLDRDNDVFIKALRKLGASDEEIDECCTRYSKNLKPYVLQWLHENVSDRKGEECNKGWAIGSIRYRSNEVSSFTIFFHRKSDAMRFIKTFSVHRKPIYYCQYFTDIRKKLNLETMKYEILG